MRATPPEWAVAEAGAPAEVWLDIRAGNASAELAYDVIWVNKTATRLPEARAFLQCFPFCFVTCDVWPLAGKPKPCLSMMHNPHSLHV